MARSVTRSIERPVARPVARPVVVLLLVALTTSISAPAVSARSCWAPPVNAPVVDPFREPACPWCPGNRGLEYGTGPGHVVRSVAAGRVTFSGRVAGIRYVVVALGDGRRVTYGGLVASTFAEGDPVVAGARVGVTDRNLHFGLRDGDVYLDPAPFLGRLVHRTRLVPVHAAERRAPGPPRLRCTDPVRAADRSGTLPGRLRPSG